MARKVRTYIYTDVKGRPRLRKVRKEPKAFHMESWVHGQRSGYWAPKVGDDALEFAEKALYHLDEVLWALRDSEPVLWAEGEKDADAIRGCGGVATTHWQGAGHATIWQAQWFASGSSPITLVADCDEPGAWCAVSRYDLLRSAGVERSQLRIVAPPKPYKDAAQALQAGRTLREFRRVRSAAVRPVAAAYAEQRSQRRCGSDWMRGAL